MGQLTWLHLSDIHFHPKLVWRDSHAQDALLKYLSQCFRDEPHLRPDLVFCTGDIAFGEMSSAPLGGQYAQAKKFFDELLKVCGNGGVALAKERLFVVPGNHDIDRNLINQSAQNDLYGKTANSAAHVGAINKRFNGRQLEFQDDMRRLEEYGKFVKSYLPHQYDKEGRICYARVVDVDGVQVGIAGLNSAWSCADDADAGNLWLAAEWQFNNAKTALKDAVLRIALMHHPIDNLNQTERDTVTWRLAADFHFFLHGHAHNAWVEPGSCVTVAVGAVGAESKAEFGINLVRLDLAAGKGEVHLHRYDKTGWTIAPVPTHAPKAVWPFALPNALMQNLEGVARLTPEPILAPHILPPEPRQAITSWQNPSTNPLPAEITKIKDEENRSGVAATSREKKIIVILTVNKHETRAVIDAFLGDKVHNQIDKGGYLYDQLGSYGDYEVLHTTCEMGSGGIGAAHSRTYDIIAAFKPHAVFAVGIAFGVNPEKQKIGDVLVSKQLEGYDLQRVSNDSITLRGDRATASSIWIQRIRAANSKHEGKTANWPTVEFGLVLSGEKLIDNRDYRDEILKLTNNEAIGGEMEGAGVYSAAQDKHTNWLVVKAICDWANNKGANKENRQKYAARNAAWVIKAAIDIADGSAPWSPLEGESISPSNDRIKQQGSPVAFGRQQNFHFLAWLRNEIENELVKGPPQFLSSLLKVTEASTNEKLLAALTPSEAQQRLEPIKWVTEAVKRIKNDHANSESIFVTALNVAGYLALATVDEKWIGHAAVLHDVPLHALTTAEIFSSGVACVPALLRRRNSSADEFGIEQSLPNGLDTFTAVCDIEMQIFAKIGLPRESGIAPTAPLTEYEHSLLRESLITLGDSKQTEKPRCAAIFIRRDKFEGHTLYSPAVREELAKRLADERNNALFKIIVWGGGASNDIPAVLVIQEAKLVAAITALLKMTGETE